MPRLRFLLFWWLTAALAAAGSPAFAEPFVDPYRSDASEWTEEALVPVECEPGTFFNKRDPRRQAFLEASLFAELPEAHRRLTATAGTAPPARAPVRLFIHRFNE